MSRLLIYAIWFQVNHTPKDTMRSQELDQPPTYDASVAPSEHSFTYIYFECNLTSWSSSLWYTVTQDHESRRQSWRYLWQQLATVPTPCDDCWSFVLPNAIERPNTESVQLRQSKNGGTSCVATPSRSPGDDMFAGWSTCYEDGLWDFGYLTLTIQWFPVADDTISTGILAAIIWFPLGIGLCLLDKRVKCQRCGLVLENGVCH